MSEKYAIILAAGQGTRMKSKVNKVLQPVCGKAMLAHVVERIRQAGFAEPIAVIRDKPDQLREYVKDPIHFVTQKEQKGTAHAVMMAEPLLAGKPGVTFVVCGDTPCITVETYKRILQMHEEHQAVATILTSYVKDPTGYGRIIRNEDGYVARIVEHKDATEEERTINEINTATYCFNNEKLFEALKQVDNKNAQGEYYLTDVIEIFQRAGDLIVACPAENEDEIIGVNDRVALAKAQEIMQRQINHSHMMNGVSMINPATTYIGPDVKIGRDTVLYPNTYLDGETVVGEDCVIGPDTQLRDTRVADGVIVERSVVLESEIMEDAKVGPFSYIRPGSQVGPRAKIGDFVELKKTIVGEGTKVPHLSYVGDTTIGQFSNIGCGVISVNYDGVNKHRTVIGDHAFIGCNSNLVAPVQVGDHAYVAAGSTVTEDVPTEALAIARARQVNKEGYVPKLMSKHGKEQNK